MRFSLASLLVLCGFAVWVGVLQEGFHTSGKPVGLENESESPSYIVPDNSVHRAGFNVSNQYSDRQPQYEKEKSEELPVENIDSSLKGREKGKFLKPELVGGRLADVQTSFNIGEYADPDEVEFWGEQKEHTYLGEWSDPDVAFEDYKDLGSPYKELGPYSNPDEAIEGWYPESDKEQKEIGQVVDPDAR